MKDNIVPILIGGIEVSVSMTKTLKHFDCCPACAVWSKWANII